MYYKCNIFALQQTYIKHTRITHVYYNEKEKNSNVIWRKDCSFKEQTYS